MIRTLVGWIVGLVLGLAAVSGSARAEDVDPKLALHLIATYEYPSCSEMAPLSVGELKTDLTSDDLAKSKGFGYVCFLVHGVDGITGVEFALRGASDVQGFKAGRIEWCAQNPLQMGDFLGRGGIVAFPCVSRVQGEEFIVAGYMSFEYRGAETIHLELVPSQYSKLKNPMSYVLDCTVQYAEHEITKLSGATIEPFIAPVAQVQRGLMESNLLWGMDANGQVDVNYMAAKDSGVPGSGMEFPTPWVVVDGTVAGVRANGEPVKVMGGADMRWVFPAGSRNRVLRFQKDVERENRSMAPWDLEVLDAAGKTVFFQPEAGHVGWISRDGSVVAWQETGHAGRLDTRFHLWKEARGEVDAPSIGVRDAEFVRGGRLVGRGVVRGDAAFQAQGGDWGVFGVDPDGRLSWWQPFPKVKAEAFAASDGGMVVARGNSGGEVDLHRWTLDGESVYSVSAEIGPAGSGSGGRMASAISPDGARVAVAWSPRQGPESYGLAVFDGRTGQLLWDRDVGIDLEEKGLAPDRLVFSGDGGRLGLLSFRPGDPPATGVTVYEDDGTLVWRRKKLNCFGMTRDLHLNESGDVVLFVVCGRANLYYIHHP